jgi:hypothetical protein
MKRVAIWNGGPVKEELGGGTRGNTEFNPNFDMGLLSEEVQEFYGWMTENNLVEMVDAVCDTRFVWEGIQFKFGMIAYSYNCDLNKVAENNAAFNLIKNYYEIHMTTMIEIIQGEGLTKKDFDTCYNFVCEANEQKGTTKDEKGKTMKGPKWYNPADKIRNHLKARGLLK